MNCSSEPDRTPSAPKAEEERYVASQWQLMWWKFRDHKLAFFSMWVVFLFYAVAIFCEPLAPNDPTRRNARRPYAPPQRIHLFHEGHLRWPFVYDMQRHKHPETLRLNYPEDRSRPLSIQLFVKGDPYRLWGVIPMDRRLIGLEGGARLYLMGADKLGRDLYSRILHGSRISLFIGLVGVFISLVLGVIIGGISGFYGGMIDALIQRTIEVIKSFPTIPLWLALAAAIPPDWPQTLQYFCITVILALVGWTSLAREVRGKFLSLREEDYVMAAKVSGVKEFSIIIRHLVPGFVSHLLVSVTIAVPFMILGETSLSFLGLGMRPPAISWGVLLHDAQNINAIVLYPWLLLPAAFVIVAVLMFNFLGDGLRDAADPYKN